MKNKKERRILKISICKAFGLHGELRTDVFNKIEGELFLSNELGLTECDVLTTQGKEVAALVGYQKYALMIIGNMISPLKSQKKGIEWDEVEAYIRSIVEEIAVPITIIKGISKT